MSDPASEMSDPASEFQSKTHSFYTLIEDKAIKIPIIQRDYAQGREDKEELLKKFLSALRDSLLKDTSITLDFIYGSTVKGSFQPLDGQQRLTTLFLLHWYVASKENVLNADVKERLSRFSYEIRFSSKDFCRSLIHNPVTIEDPKNLSQKIKDSHWFFLSWEKDPTIDAMLRSIDCIHSLFFDISSLWNSLTSKNLISFNYVELEHIGLSDDLYIRMNARGKLLTPFEKFKAEFEKYLLNEKKWENKLSPKEKFAIKIDTT